MRSRRLATALAAALAVCLPAAAAGLAPTEALAANAKSANWAGYAVSGAGVRFRDVRASWVQPAVSCPTRAPSFAAMWVGLGGYHTTSRALEQIGTEADCQGGRARYGAWYELVPAASRGVRMTVHPGDRLAASVHAAGRRVTLTLRNLARGQSFARTFSPSAVDTTSAEWIMEAPAMCTGAANGDCRVLPLADFGRAAFGVAQATSTAGHAGTISDAAWSATAIDLAASGPMLGEPGGRRGGAGAGAATGPLSASGSAFAVTFAAQ